MLHKAILFLSKNVKELGTQMIYSVLLMVFAYRSSETPKWAKRIILGAFTYLLSPFDSIPDLTPVIGFTDDLSVITFGLVTISCYITNDIRSLARKKLNTLVKNTDESLLEAVDARL